MTRTVVYTSARRSLLALTHRQKPVGAVRQSSTGAHTSDESSQQEEDAPPRRPSQSVASLAELFTPGPSTEPQRLSHERLNRLPTAAWTAPAGAGAVSWLHSEQGPAVRLAKLARGGFSQIFVGVDQNQKVSAWRMLTLGPGARSADGLAPTALADLEGETRALVEVQSPLAPQRSFLVADAQGNAASRHLFIERPLFRADLFNVMGPLYRSRRPLGDVFVHLARDAAMELFSVHKRGWLHRDIKENNFLFGGLDTTTSPAGSNVRIADFGFATRLTDIRRRNKSIGTLGFMAPEAIGLGRAIASAKTDQYAFGAMLGRLFTSFQLFRSPLSGMHERVDAAGVKYLAPDANGLHDGLLQVRDFVRANMPAPSRAFAERAKGLVPVDILFAMIAQHSRAVAELLFTRLLTLDGDSRLSAGELAAELHQLQPRGSAADQRAAAALEAATAELAIGEPNRPSLFDRIELLKAAPTTPRP